MVVDEQELLGPIQSEIDEAGVDFYKIVSYPADWTLHSIHHRWERGTIIIPKFQRGWVWNQIQASRLIESFLLGLPVPSILVFNNSLQSQLVLDGHQRLRTICSFFQEVLPSGAKFSLKGVHPEWEGKCYSTLEEADKLRLENSVLRIVIVEQIEPRDDTSIYHIFERLNTGGTDLNQQEVRSCVYNGPFNDCLIDLNKDTEWRSIFGQPRPDRRMRDLELIVRFLALSDSLDSYSKPMKKFLNDFMATHRYESNESKYKSRFLDTVRLVTDTLGERPFHLRGRGINAAAFDSVMVAFAGSNQIPSDVNGRFQKLLDNPSYKKTITSGTTDVDTVKRRIKLAQEILFN